jgi:squalene cyclase
MKNFKDSSTKNDVESAIIKALEFIVSNQSESGSWIDWTLPPGGSDAWTTAFIGCKLKSAPYHLKNMILGSTTAASEWLIKKQHSDGGWGYNDFVGSDADSTAHTIIFLDSMGKTVPQNAYFLLGQFQSHDGGFSTYMCRHFNGSWAASHPDVTAVALMAFMTRYRPNHPVITKGTEYVLGQQTSKGIWNSFWWKTFLYSTEVNLAFLNAVNNNLDQVRIRETLLKIKPQNAFEDALLISSILYTNQYLSNIDMIMKIVNHLLNTQQSNGSWKSVPSLRLCDRKCFKPWEYANSGPLYLDPKRFFTTSTVVEALCKVFDHLSHE